MNNVIFRFGKEFLKMKSLINNASCIFWVCICDIILLSYPIFDKLINVQNKYFSKRHQSKVASNFRDESVQEKQNNEIF